MKIVVFLMCVLGSTLAAPAADSDEQTNSEDAKTALQLMELYSLIGKLRQQAAPAQADAQSQIPPQGPQQDFNPALIAPEGDGSDEEETPVQAAAPLNSDEAAEEVEAVGATEGAKAVAEPTGAAPAVDAGTANEVPPVDVAVEVPVAAGVPSPDVTAAAVEPSVVPQEPVVAIETDTTVVGPEVATGAEQVLVSETPDAALPV